MSASLIPVPKMQFFSNAGLPLSGGFVYSYLAGSSTPQATYTDSTGLVANPNPVVLDSSGRANIWLSGYYKIAVYDAAMNLIYTVDNVSSSAASSAQSSQWVPQTFSLTYINATQFSVLTDQTILFIPGLRVKATVTAGTLYGTVSASVSGGGPVATTVTVVWDSGSLDSGLSALWTGIISPASLPVIPVKTKTGSYSVSTTDVGGILEMNSAAPASFTLPVASGVSSGSGYIFKNIGAGLLTIVGTIDGVANPTLAQYGSMTIYSDASSWYRNPGYATAADIIAAVAGKAISPDVLAASSMIVQSGTIQPWPVSTVPSGYLECNGALVLKATYAALYNVLKDGGASCIYGESGLSFYLPDYRGYFLRGWSHGQATDPDKANRTNRGDGTAGDFVGTKQASDYLAHTHPISPIGTGWTSGSRFDGYADGSAADRTTGTSPVTGGNETRPLNINVMWIIKT